MQIAAGPCIPIACNDSRDIAKRVPEGIEPPTGNAGNYSTECQSVKTAVGKTVGISKLPPDLQQIFDHWNALPTEIKQTILTLVKHARNKKCESIP